MSNIFRAIEENSIRAIEENCVTLNLLIETITRYVEALRRHKAIFKEEADSMILQEAFKFCFVSKYELFPRLCLRVQFLR